MAKLVLRSCPQKTRTTPIQLWTNVSRENLTGISFPGFSGYGQNVPSAWSDSSDSSYRLLAFIDRSNIGNAKIDGLIKDLDLTGDRFNIALVVFYVPYSTYLFLNLGAS
jgi:hypothetical protein